MCFCLQKKNRFVLKFTPTVVFCSPGCVFPAIPPFLVPGCPKELVPSSFFFTVAQLQNAFQESQDPFPPILNQDLGTWKKKQLKRCQIAKSSRHLAEIWSTRIISHSLRKTNLYHTHIQWFLLQYIWVCIIKYSRTKQICMVFPVCVVGGGSYRIPVYQAMGHRLTWCWESHLQRAPKRQASGRTSALTEYTVV